MTPSSWSVRKTAEVFDVSNYMVRKAFRLREEKGILATPEAKKGSVLPDTVQPLVKEFYCDDENSRLLPGKKDYVSIGRNHHMQTRLILSNLKELYSSFKEKNPAVKIGFSKFCMPRPKWCITIGASGTHSVCVCTSHQNVILLLNAVKIDKTYELIEMIVYSLGFYRIFYRNWNIPLNILQRILEYSLEFANHIEYSIRSGVFCDKQNILLHF